MANPLDFTLDTYNTLLNTIINSGYKTQILEKFFSQPETKVIVLRHDVDKKPHNALLMARLESRLDIKSTYFFRIKTCSYDEDTIKKISDMGHEIGYHYEDLSESRGNFQQAINLFAHHLEIFRKLYPVKTIAMHGSPLSKWDNKLIWQDYDYKEYGIIGEPYFDVNYEEVFYLTDTGRGWNKRDTIVRDQVSSKYSDNFSSTHKLISAFKGKKLPKKIIINTHPQRWNNALIPWIGELVSQNIKNIVKRYIRLSRNEN